MSQTEQSHQLVFHVRLWGKPWDYLVWLTLLSAWPFRKEWERDTELKYQVQSGTFKDVSVRLRNSTYRSNYEQWARDMDETRVIVSYNFSIF